MPPILVVGSVAYDTVKTPFGQATEALGGSATYFSVSAGFFTRVFLVAAVGQDFSEKDWQFLETRNIDLQGLEKVEGKTFRWVGEYGYDLNDAHTIDTQLNVLAEFRPKLSETHQNLEYIFLGNLDPRIQREVLAQVHKPRLVACDTMNYWISGHFNSLVETLRQVDILIINDAEARQLTRESNLIRAARKIHGWGPQTVVVKRGEYGALMFQQGCQGRISVFGTPAYPLEDIYDPTGAGDTFAGGFMGYLAGIGRSDWVSLRQAVVFGSVMASFNVERFSLDRLKNLTFTEIELRYKEFKEMTRIDDVVEWQPMSRL
ncbi:MAG TPA: PfkB family carbohydrate kinase [Acidobacteriota bacterium]|nr:PfkB family carbohydrate kinase [Acidobacteriota bacterium]